MALPAYRTPTNNLKPLSGPFDSLSLEDQALARADANTQQSPEELSLLGNIAGDYDAANQGVKDQSAALGQRGDDLNVLDEDAFNRSFQPALSRLKHDYDLQDRNIMEDMNRRGIVSQGSSNPDAPVAAGSEPEMYQRSLLARDSKEQMTNATLSAQQAAMNQKLQQYQARTTETDQANKRFDSVSAPLYNSTLTDANERMGAKTNLASNTFNARLGNQTQQNQINSNRKLQTQQMQMGIAGAGLGALGMAIGSDENAKYDIENLTDEEHSEILDRFHDIKVSRWKYKDDPDGQEHIGGMVQDMPEEVVTQDKKHYSLPSYLGMLTSAVQQLDKRTRGSGLRGLHAQLKEAV